MRAILKRSRKGAMLLMTLLVSVVLISVGVSILFTSLNQSRATQDMTDDIQAQEIAKGVLWQQAYSEFGGAAASSEVINSKTYNSTVTLTDPATNQYTIDITY